MRTVIDRRIEAFGKAANNGGISHLEFDPDSTLLMLVERDAREAIANHKSWIAFYEKTRRVACGERLFRARKG